MTPAESNVALDVTRYRRAALKRPDHPKTMRLYGALVSSVKALVRDCYDAEGWPVPGRYR